MILIKKKSKELMSPWDQCRNFQQVRCHTDCMPMHPSSILPMLKVLVVRSGIDNSVTVREIPHVPQKSPRLSSDFRSERYPGLVEVVLRDSVLEVLRPLGLIEVLVAAHHHHPSDKCTPKLWCEVGRVKVGSLQEVSDRRRSRSEVDQKSAKWAVRTAALERVDQGVAGSLHVVAKTLAQQVDDLVAELGDSKELCKGPDLAQSQCVEWSGCVSSRLRALRRLSGLIVVGTVRAFVKVDDFDSVLERSCAVENVVL
jgi:hypothetical protein